MNTCGKSYREMKKEKRKILPSQFKKRYVTQAFFNRKFNSILQLKQSRLEQNIHNEVKSRF